VQQGAVAAAQPDGAAAVAPQRPGVVAVAPAARLLAAAAGPASRPEAAGPVDAARCSPAVPEAAALRVAEPVPAVPHAAAWGPGVAACGLAAASPVPLARTGAARLAASLPMARDRLLPARLPRAHRSPAAGRVAASIRVLEERRLEMDR
jgi:hypothetical protein